MDDVGYGKLDRGVKKRWVKALRSGKYKQGTRSLAYKDSEGNTYYCCLGVFCEISTRTKREVSGRTLMFSDGDKFESNFIPSSTAKKIGITQAGQDKLAVMNDKGNSFAEIADWIEANL